MSSTWSSAWRSPRFQQAVMSRPTWFRTGRQVCRRHEVEQRLRGAIEFGEFPGQAALLGFYLCPRVVRDEADDELGPALTAQVARSVERVEPCDGNRWGVADVMKPGGRDNRDAVLGASQARQSAGTTSDTLNVSPPRSKRSQEAFAERGGSRRQCLGHVDGHSPTLSRRFD
jgi:hypothetical protein